VPGCHFRHSLYLHHLTSWLNCEYPKVRGPNLGYGIVKKFCPGAGHKHLPAGILVKPGEKKCA